MNDHERLRHLEDGIRSTGAGGINFDELIHAIELEAVFRRQISGEIPVCIEIIGKWPLYAQKETK